ncbi:unnamed protein product [Calypogeia fissa]
MGDGFRRHSSVDTKDKLLPKSLPHEGNNFDLKTIIRDNFGQTPYLNAPNTLIRHYSQVEGKQSNPKTQINASNNLPKQELDTWIEFMRKNQIGDLKKLKSKPQTNLGELLKQKSEPSGRNSFSPKSGPNPWMKLTQKSPNDELSKFKGKAQGDSQRTVGDNFRPRRGSSVGSIVSTKNITDALVDFMQKNQAENFNDINRRSPTKPRENSRQRSESNGGANFRQKGESNGGDNFRQNSQGNGGDNFRQNCQANGGDSFRQNNQASGGGNYRQKSESNGKGNFNRKSQANGGDNFQQFKSEVNERDKFKQNHEGNVGNNFKQQSSINRGCSLRQNNERYGGGSSRGQTQAKEAQENIGLFQQEHFMLSNPLFHQALLQEKKFESTVDNATSNNNMSASQQTFFQTLGQVVAERARAATKVPDGYEVNYKGLFVKKKPVISTLPLDKVEELCETLSSTRVIGRFPNWNPSTKDLEPWIKEMNKSGLPVTFDRLMGNGYFMMNVPDSETQKALIGLGPQFIGDHLCLLHKWIPNFSPTSPSTAKYGIWVSLQYLPEEMRPFIGDLLKPVGEVLEVIPNVGDGVHSHACIATDLEKFDPDITFTGPGGRQCKQSVDIHGIPIRCWLCKSPSHGSENCPKGVSGGFQSYAKNPKGEEDCICETDCRGSQNKQDSNLLRKIQEKTQFAFSDPNSTNGMCDSIQSQTCTSLGLENYCNIKKVQGNSPSSKSPSKCA